MQQLMQLRKDYAELTEKCSEMQILQEYVGGEEMQIWTFSRSVSHLFEHPILGTVSEPPRGLGVGQLY